MVRCTRGHVYADEPSPPFPNTRLYRKGARLCDLCIIEKLYELGVGTIVWEDPKADV